MKFNPVLGPDEWKHALERFVNWAEFLKLHPNVAFNRIAKLFGNEHFGVESATIDNWEDINETDDAPTMYYLNMGESYSTTLVVTDDYLNGNKLLVCCWADWMEENERHHCEQSQVIRCGNCGHLTPFNYGKDEHHNHQCEFCHKNVSGGEYRTPERQA